MIETIICGKVSGNFIVESLFKLKDIIEISGIFEVNSKTTIRDAYFNNLPLFTNIKNIPNNTKLAYVPFNSEINRDVDIVRYLLNRGINVIEEIPKSKKDTIKYLKEIKSKNCYYLIRNLYEETEISKMFIRKAKQIMQEQKIIYIDSFISKDMLFSIFKLIKSSLNENFCFDIKTFSHDEFITISGKISEITFCFKVYDPININNRCKYYENKLEFVFEDGSLILEIFKNIIIWENRRNLFFDKDNININLYNAEQLLNLKTSFTVENKTDLNDELLLLVKKQITFLDNMKNDGRKYLPKVHEIIKDVQLFDEFECLVRKFDLKDDLTIKQNSYLSSNLEKNEWLYETPNLMNIHSIQDVERRYSFIDHVHVNKFLESINMYIYLSMILFFQNNGVFIDCNRKYNINEIIEKNFNSRNKNIILRWLNILFENEFIHLENNNCYLRKVVNKNNIDRYYEDAKNLWDWKLGDPLSIDYINQNIKYLQELFDGKKKCNSILFPGGDLKYAKALYKNNMVYRYINDLVAITISDYVKKYSSGINKIKILEIGAGIGATTDSVLKRLIDENLIDEVLYKYTDISNFFIQCAKSKYENVVSNIEYEKIDIDKDMEKLGKETFDIVIAVGVLNNSGKLNTVLREIYNTVKKDSLILIAEPVKEPPEMLVSQVFMMTKPTDIRLEKNRTFLNRLEWLDLLKDTFDKKQILTYPKNTHALYEFGQQLFVVKI